VSLDGEANWDDERVKRAEQLVYKATVLSKVVKTNTYRLARRDVPM
jgi:hypothetical protein